MNKGIKLSILSFMLLAGCKSIKNRQDIVAYTENPENGLRKEVVLGDMTYTFQYKPTSYILEREHADPSAEKERKKALSGVAWFNISFKVNNWGQSPLRYKVSGTEEYTARQDYYLNQAAKDMYLLYGKDTLYASSYWFENNQNLTPYETMIAGFKLPDEDAFAKKDLHLAFYDRVFKNGIIKTVIKADDVKNVSDPN